MLRSILVALDDTPGAQAARDAAFALARRTGAKLTVAVVLDRPHTDSDHEFVPIGGAAFKARRDAKLAAQAEADATAALAACAARAGDTPYEVLRLEDAPEPALLAAGAAHDLIIVGRDSTLGREETEDGVAPVIEELLKDGTKPLLVVPPEGARADGPVLAAYDGSSPARAALRALGTLGLTESSPVIVATVGDAATATEGAAARPGATALALGGDDEAAAILGAVSSHHARMLVIGAFGSGVLKRLLAGSLTHTLIRDAKVPVLLARSGA